jgi:hypothetical protein
LKISSYSPKIFLFVALSSTGRQRTVNIRFGPLADKPPTKMRFCPLLSESGQSPCGCIGKIKTSSRRKQAWLKVFYSRKAHAYGSKTNGARHAHLQKPPRHHDCEQSSTFRLARELSPRSAPAGIARDRARKGPPNFAEEPFSDVPLAAVLTNWRNQNSESQQTMSALPCQ